MDSNLDQDAAADTDNTLSALWQIDDLEYDCDCPGPPPPPVFKIPPPPRPPFLPELDCSDFNSQDFDSCDLLTVTDAGYHGNPALPTLTIVGICTALLLAASCIVFAFAWRNKKKVQNFLPCKSSPQNRCDAGHGTGVIYEDLAPVRNRNPADTNSFEMLDVKSARGNSYVIGARPPVFVCSPIVRHEHEYGPPPRQDSRRYCSQDLYNPVYEELSNGSGDRCDSDRESDCVPGAAGSEDEFAEDELSLGDHCHQHQQLHSGASSLQGSTGNDLCRDVDSSDADDRSRFLCHRGPPCLRNHRGGSRNLSLPASRRSKQHGAAGNVSRHASNGQPRSQRSSHENKRPRSLDRKGHCCKSSVRIAQPNLSAANEFHEGMLLDALYQFYPAMINAPANSNHPSLPYILPVANSGTVHHHSAGRLIDPYESVPVLDQIRAHRNHRLAPSTTLQHYHNSYSHNHQPRCHFPSNNNVNNSNSGNNTNNNNSNNNANNNTNNNNRNSDDVIHAFRSPVGKPTSQDSDSGYSNNTSGGRASSSSRSRIENPTLLSTPNDYPLQ